MQGGSVSDAERLHKHLHEVHHLPRADEVAQLVRDDRRALRASARMPGRSPPDPALQAPHAAVLRKARPRAADPPGGRTSTDCGARPAGGKQQSTLRLKRHAHCPVSDEQAPSR